MESHNLDDSFLPAIHIVMTQKEAERLVEEILEDVVIGFVANKWAKSIRDTLRESSSDA